MHILAGHPWEAQIELAFRHAALSVLRGLGVARQSAPFDVEMALNKVQEHVDVNKNCWFKLWISTILHAVCKHDHSPLEHMKSSQTMVCLRLVFLI